MVLTVKGKAAAVAQDPEAYQRLLDIAALADSDLAYLNRAVNAENSEFGLKCIKA